MPFFIHLSSCVPSSQGQSRRRRDDGVPEGQLDPSGALQLAALSVRIEPGVGEDCHIL